MQVIQHFYWQCEDLEGGDFSGRQDTWVLFNTYDDFLEFVHEYVNRRNPEIDTKLHIFIQQAWYRIAFDTELPFFNVGIDILLIDSETQGNFRYPEFIVRFPLHFYHLEKILSNWFLLNDEEADLPLDFWVTIKRIQDIYFLELKPDAWERIKSGGEWLKREDIVRERRLDYVSYREIIEKGGMKRKGIPTAWGVEYKFGDRPLYGDYEGRPAYLIFDRKNEYYALRIFMYAVPRELRMSELWQRYPFLIAKAVNYEVLRFLGEVELANQEYQAFQEELQSVLLGEAQKDTPSIFPLKLVIHEKQFM